MSQAQNIAAQEKLGKGVVEGNLDVIEEVFAPDVVDHDPAPGQGPGNQGIKEFWTELRTAFPDLALQVERLVADDETVSLTYTLTATHDGPFQGIDPTGKQIEVRGLQTARFEDGKIVERWGATDELGILKQIGAAP